MMKLVKDDVPNSLEEKTSKYDVIYDGKKIKLVLHPCNCGVRANWVVEIKQIDAVPDFMKEMMSEEQKNSIIEKTLEEWHFHPTWFQKHILRHTLEKQLKKWIDKSHAEYVKLKNSFESLESIVSKL